MVFWLGRRLWAGAWKQILRSKRALTATGPIREHNLVVSGPEGQPSEMAEGVREHAKGILRHLDDVVKHDLVCTQLECILRWYCTGDTTYDIPLKLLKLQVGEFGSQLARTTLRAPRKKITTIVAAGRAHHDHNNAIPSKQSHRCRRCARPEGFSAFGYHSWGRYPVVDSLQKQLL